jgi:glycosyltransferase involved in cell wall biosynthesis
LPPLRIVQANAVYDPAITNANALLDLYHTLTEWSVAVAGTGAGVSVVQRFHTAGRVERDGVPYEFVKDPEAPWLPTRAAPEPLVAAIAQHAPDVVHVNGLIFPQLVAEVRKAVGPRTVIVAQHHGGEFPVIGSGLVGMWRRARWKGGLSHADAFSFTAREQAEPWRAAGVLGDQRVLEIVESGTTMRPVDKDRARTAIGVTGDPLILWVGRLTTNKDPLTVLTGLEHALPALPNGRVVMVFADDTLLPDVEARVRGSSVLEARVTLEARVPREEMPNYYSAADVFISGSHYEGSGYALIEAMSAGLVPIVTDIPSFRSITGDSGERWQPGDADEFASAVRRVASIDLSDQKARVRAHYEHVLRWEAIAHRTVAEYQSLVDERRAPGP